MTIELEKDLKVNMCQKVFQRKMVLEEEEGNLVEVAVGILEREKEQIAKGWFIITYTLSVRALIDSRLELNPPANHLSNILS